MHVDQLIPLHNTLRNTKTVQGFVHRLRMGHIFRGIETPIVISRVCNTDKKILDSNNCEKYVEEYYLHDGHHRVYAAWLCGIKELMPCEYTMKYMSYAMYLDLNVDVGWVTPLDIRTHVRKPDFGHFKNKAIKIYLDKDNPSHVQDCTDYIEENQDMYLEERKVTHVKDMVL